ncbi:MAG: metal-sensitive transcriptional regulator [Deferrisomatales bacterium]|nr:metal-sensitive transcriptional regulator [Deferrisomatales bacterium]
MPLCGHDHTPLVHRINRIEGQVKGLRKMVEDDRDCFDVLKQIAATNGAVRALGMAILEEHLKGCIAGAPKEGHPGDQEELIRQVVDLFNKFS